MRIPHGASTRPIPADQPGAYGRRRPLFGLALLLALGSCATDSPTVFHTLMPVERPAAVSAAAGPVIHLERVRVPEAVNQPQWLIRLPDGTLAQLERERWASPPSDEIGQALREILRLRFNFSEAQPGGPRAAWHIRVEVLRLDTLPGEARLETQWSVAGEGAQSPSVRCTSFLREPAAGGGMAALGDAHRRAVGRLGTLIGEQVLALTRGAGSSCPT